MFRNSAQRVVQAQTRRFASSAHGKKTPNVYTVDDRQFVNPNGLNWTLPTVLLGGITYWYQGAVAENRETFYRGETLQDVMIQQGKLRSDGSAAKVDFRLH